MKSRLLLAAAMLLSLPALAGRLTDADKLNQLEPGKTTAAQTVELLGKPNQENRSPDGRYAYMYEFDLPNQADPSQPSLQGVAALLFSTGNVLEDVQMFKKAEGTKN
jgi:outer membrane protein assembly factor BamE (lipoprotein component of BamABCDE complex)